METLHMPITFSSCTLRVLEAASKYAAGGDDFCDVLEDCNLRSTQTIIHELSLEYLRLCDSISSTLALPDDLPQGTVIQVRDDPGFPWNTRCFSNYSTDDDGNRIIQCSTESVFTIKDDDLTSWKYGRLLSKENLEYYLSSEDK